MPKLLFVRMKRLSNDSRCRGVEASSVFSISLKSLTSESRGTERCSLSLSQLLLFSPPLVALDFERILLVFASTSLRSSIRNSCCRCIASKYCRANLASRYDGLKAASCENGCNFCTKSLISAAFEILACPTSLGATSGYAWGPICFSSSRTSALQHVFC